MAGIERIFELFKEAPELTGGEPIDTIDRIEFRNVEFSYNEDDRVLQNLNLTINRGEKVALVGESGKGKSTLVKMILKFYFPTKGELFLSGINLKDIETKSLRQKIAYISQRQMILEDDLLESRNNELVLNLLKKFKFYKSIAEIDANLHQKEFSGGEVQKIEMIENLLKPADMLIIDEGTSNIDFKAEGIVLNEMFEKYKDKIIIFIAHRLTSVTDFERILVIDNGRIVEDGDHESLIEKKGYYSSLWGKQKKI